MIHVIATITTHPGRRKDFLKLFRDLVPLVHAERGCMEYGPAIDLPTPIKEQAPVRDDVITVVEKWETVQALQDHLAATHMQQYRAAVKDIVAGVEIRIMQPA